MPQQIRGRDQADWTSANDEHSVMHADGLGLLTWDPISGSLEDIIDKPVWLMF
jgi:hypothetical protein